jgi:hypothetical protein
LVQLRATRPIRLSPEAHHWRAEVEQVANDRMIWPATPSAMRDHLHKWRGKFVRLLLLFHVVECVSNGRAIESNVSGDTAERARDLMLDFVLPCQLQFYTRFFDKTDTIKSDARWIAGHILAHRSQQITEREIRRAYGLDTETASARITIAMRTLEEASWVGSREDNPSKRSVTWAVNGRVHELFAERAAGEKAERAATMRRIAEVGARLKAEGKTRNFSRPVEEPEVW